MLPRYVATYKGPMKQHYNVKQTEAQKKWSKNQNIQWNKKNND